MYVGRPLDALAYLKRSIVKVKAETNYQAHALVIAIAKIKTILIIIHIFKDGK